MERTGKNFAEAKREKKKKSIKRMRKRERDGSERDKA